LDELNGGDLKIIKLNDLSIVFVYIF